jgi:hypothetical protein
MDEEKNSQICVINRQILGFSKNILHSAKHDFWQDSKEKCLARRAQKGFCSSEEFMNHISPRGAEKPLSLPAYWSL